MFSIFQQAIAYFRHFENFYLFVYFISDKSVSLTKLF